MYPDECMTTTYYILNRISFNCQIAEGNLAVYSIQIYGILKVHWDLSWIYVILNCMIIILYVHMEFPMLQICIYLCIPWRVEWNVYHVVCGGAGLEFLSWLSEVPPLYPATILLTIPIHVTIYLFCERKRVEKIIKKTKIHLKLVWRTFHFLLNTCIYAIWIYIFGNNMKWKLHFEFQYDGVWMVEGVYSFVRVYFTYRVKYKPPIAFLLLILPPNANAIASQPQCSQQCFHSFILFWKIVMFSLALFKEFRVW